MRITGQQESPYRAEDLEVFKGLHMVGKPGKVRVTVSERKLSIEQKTGEFTEIDHDWVMRLNQTSKPLLPTGWAVVGAVLLLVAYRGLVLGTSWQLLTIGVGMLLLTGRFGTKRPTLTIETQANDCHILTGNAAVLMRLCYLHSRLAEGQSMEIARLGLEDLQRDVDYPRSEASPLIPVEPVRIEASPSIAALLANHGNPEDLPESAVPLNLFGTEEPLDLDFEQPPKEGWMFGEPESSGQQHIGAEHGLIQRGRANARQRTHALPQPTTSDHQPIHYNHPSHPYPVNQPMNTERSYGRIAETNQNLPQHHAVEPAQEIPQSFLPSFVGPEGAHVPQPAPAPMSTEAEFDLEFTNLFSEEEEAVTSIVDAARRGAPPLDAELVHHQSQPVPQHTQYKIEPRNSGYANPQFIHKRRRRNGNRVQALIQGIGRTASMAGQLLTGETVQALKGEAGTESSHELRGRSTRTHQQEIENSVSNLSEQHGGVLPKETVEQMMKHIDRRHTLAEQIQQEQGPASIDLDLDNLSFDDLVEHENEMSDAEQASHLPRLDS